MEEQQLSLRAFVKLRSCVDADGHVAGHIEIESKQTPLLHVCVCVCVEHTDPKNLWS